MCWNNYNRCQISRIRYRKYHTEANVNSEKELYLNQQERLNKLVQNENYRYWLGGFIEGEGSLVVSIFFCKKKIVKHGLILQPEFNVVQHVNGIDILYSFKALFDYKGYLHKKSGSDNV